MTGDEAVHVLDVVPQAVRILQLARNHPVLLPQPAVVQVGVEEELPLPVLQVVQPVALVVRAVVVVKLPVEVLLAVHEGALVVRAVAVEGVPVPRQRRQRVEPAQVGVSLVAHHGEVQHHRLAVNGFHLLRVHDVVAVRAVAGGDALEGEGGHDARQVLAPSLSIQRIEEVFRRLRAVGQVVGGIQLLVQLHAGPHGVGAGGVGGARGRVFVLLHFCERRLFVAEDGRLITRFTRNVRNFVVRFLDKQVAALGSESVYRRSQENLGCAAERHDDGAELLDDAQKLRSAQEGFIGNEVKTVLEGLHESLQRRNTTSMSVMSRM